MLQICEPTLRFRTLYSMYSRPQLPAVTPCSSSSRMLGLMNDGTDTLLGFSPPVALLPPLPQLPQGRGTALQKIRHRCDWRGAETWTKAGATSQLQHEISLAKRGTADSPRRLPGRVMHSRTFNSVSCRARNMWGEYVGSLLQLILPGAHYRILDDICVLHFGSIYAQRNGNHKTKCPLQFFIMHEHTKLHS